MLFPLLEEVSIPGRPESPANVSIRDIPRIRGHLLTRRSAACLGADRQKHNLN